MDKESCPICSESWLISDCRTIYYFPSDPLQYFIKEKDEVTKGCPKCDSKKWAPKIYESIY